MRPLILLALLSSCAFPGRPDRYSVTGGRSRGDIDTGDCRGPSDMDGHYLEVGISGPLGTPQERRRPPACPEPIQARSALSEAPAQSGGFPWAEVLYAAGAILTWKGGEYGVRRYRSRKS